MKATVLLPLLLVALASGCATVPYPHGRNIETANMLQLRPGEAQIERGRPNALIDGIGWVFGIPSKIILLDSRMDNHVISTGVEQALVEYLATNDLRNVKVRINEYAPGGEWSRLFRNKSVGWGWRYTIGVLANLFYTTLPGRIFGGDNYNPYTNTINLYSNHRAVAIHEGAHAKDFAPRNWKGTYAFFYIVPFVALFPEAKATGDAVGYMRVDRTAEEEKEAYKVLYPAYGTYIGGSFGQFTPIPYVIYFAAVIPGHIAGRVKASHVDERRELESSASAAPAQP